MCRGRQAAIGDAPTGVQQVVAKNIAEKACEQAMADDPQGEFIVSPPPPPTPNPLTLVLSQMAVYRGPGDAHGMLSKLSVGVEVVHCVFGAGTVAALEWEGPGKAKVFVHFDLPPNNDPMVEVDEVKVYSTKDFEEEQARVYTPRANAVRTALNQNL